MPAYVARVSADDGHVVRIYRVDGRNHTPVDALSLPHGNDLRSELEANGWHPTGQRGPGGRWGAIYVEPTNRG